MKAKVIFFSTKGKQRHEFSFKIHRSDNVADQQIEPEFYKQWASIPQGTHYELEIVSPNLRECLFASKIHYHTSTKNLKDFICWTGHIQTPEQLTRIVNMWCAGTAHTIETGEDFTKLYVIHDIGLDDFEKMNQVLKDDYGIVFESGEYDLN